MVGFFPNYAEAHKAWLGKARETIDNAQMRYFIVHLHRLLDPATAKATRKKRLNRSILLSSAEGIGSARVITRQNLKAGFRLNAILLHLLDQFFHRIELLVGPDEIDEFHQKRPPIKIFIHVKQVHFKKRPVRFKSRAIAEISRPAPGLRILLPPSRTRTV